MCACLCSVHMFECVCLYLIHVCGRMHGQSATANRQPEDILMRFLTVDANQ